MIFVINVYYIHARKEGCLFLVFDRVTPQKGVNVMIKYDVLTGLLIGVVLGLVFTAPLSAHLPLLVILAIVFGGRMISLK